MRVPFAWRGRDLELVVINLCHYGESGDYEVFFTEDLGLDPRQAAALLHDQGYEVARPTARSVLVRDGGAELTIFDSGRIILENVRPGTFDDAIRLGRRALDILQGAG